MDEYDNLYVDIIQMLMSPGLFRIDENILFDTPYVNIFLSFIDKLDKNREQKKCNFESVILDKSLNWVDFLLYAIDEEKYTSEIKNYLFESSMEKKIVIVEKTNKI